MGALATAVAVSTASIPASGLAAGRTAHGIVKHPLDASGIVKNPLDAHELSRKTVAAHPNPGAIRLRAPKVVKLASHPAVQVKDASLTPTHKRDHPKRPPAWSAVRHGTVTATDPVAPSAPVSTAPKRPVTLVAVPSQPAPQLWSTGGPGAIPKDRHHSTASRPVIHPDQHHMLGHGRPTGGAPISPPLNTTSQLQPVPASLSSARDGQTEPAAAGTGGLFGGTSGSTSELSGNPPASLLSRMFAETQGPPPFLISIYRRAAQRYQVPWPVLAAINSIESDYGRNLSVSSAGAVGWMQFMPGTWREYGVDANHDGKSNPYDPTDAIFAAARYLRANGAPHDLRRAVFAYNHATWYVDEVMLRARWISVNSKLTVKGASGRRIASMTAMAELLVGRPYVWGGGHGGWQIVPGYDCSGFVSAVLHAGGYLSTPQTTDTLPSQPGIQTGPGRYVTIFDRTASGTQGHVIVDLNGTFYESGGSAASGGGAGVKKLGQPPYDYLLSFNTILHPAGL